MVVPKSTDIVLKIDDFLSEQEYDRKKAGIISRVVNSHISVDYKRDINCAFETDKGFRIVKAKPKLKSIDGNTAMNHELAHILFNSFDKRAAETIRKWSVAWTPNGKAGQETLPSYYTAFDTYHTAMNVIEDQRIESLWGKIYLGNIKDFVNVRKKLGKALKFIDHPSAILLAERFFRPDLIIPSKYSIIAKLIHDVEGKDITSTMIVMNKIKPYLDEMIRETNKNTEDYKIANEKFNKTLSKISTWHECQPPLSESEKDRIHNDRKFQRDECDKLSSIITKNIHPTSVEKRGQPRIHDYKDSDIKEYSDEELGSNQYNEALKASEERSKQQLVHIKQSMEGTDMIITPTYIRCKEISKQASVKPTVDIKIVAELKKLLRSFKEKTHEDVSDEGYELDIGEYINMKANGYGDCFIEEKETNGLSIVMSIDGSGSMATNNNMVANMIKTITEATKDVKEIDIKTIVWSSDKKGDVALQRFEPNDIQYLACQRGGYTPTNFGIEAGSNTLANMKGKRKLLILITDGFPNYHVNGVKVRTDATTIATIKAYKKALRVTPNIAVIGVGMIGNGGHMKNMFGDKYIHCRSMNEVRNFMTTKLRKEIVRVMKR